jgi:hypothetical protein
MSIPDPTSIYQAKILGFVYSSQQKQPKTEAVLYLGLSGTYKNIPKPNTGIDA